MYRIGAILLLIGLSYGVGVSGVLGPWMLEGVHLVTGYPALR
jgi:hypothetical protein